METVVYGKNGMEVLYLRAKFGTNWFTHGDTGPKNKIFVFVCLLHWVWPVLVLQSCCDVWQFNDT